VPVPSAIKALVKIIAFPIVASSFSV